MKFSSSEFALYGFHGAVLVSLASSLDFADRARIKNAISSELSAGAEVVFAQQVMEETTNTAILRFVDMPKAVEEVETVIKAVDWSKKAAPVAIGIELMQPINGSQRAVLWSMIVKAMEDLKIGTPFVPPLFPSFGLSVFPENRGPMRRGRLDFWGNELNEPSGEFRLLPLPLRAERRR